MGWGVNGGKGEGYPELALVPVLGEGLDGDGALADAFLYLRLEHLKVFHTGITLGVELRERFQRMG